MGFDINWGLAAPVDVGGALTNGFQRGQAMRQEYDTKAALAAYGTNPSEQTAGALLRVDPRLGMQALTQERGKAQQLRQQQITSQAVTGDPAAKAQLAGLNPELWMKLDDRTKEQVKKSTEFMGNAAYDVSRAPPEQRAQMWHSYVQRAEASGMDIPTQYETYSPEALNAVVAEVGKMENFIKFNEPEYKVIPQGGYAQGFQYGVPIPGGPSTTQPPQPGAPSGGPQPGAVVNGYRFKGGPVNDPQSWEAAGGAGPGPQTFQPMTSISGQGIPAPIRPGNIDLANRPKVRNKDGSISTVLSMSFGTPDGEVLVPKVSDDGRIMSDREAMDNYYKTGRSLGVFRTPQEADTYAEALHRQQERMYTRPATANEAAPILRNAQSTGRISRADAERVRSALGANGGESFQQWLAQHNIRIADQ